MYVLPWGQMSFWGAVVPKMEESIGRVYELSKRRGKSRMRANKRIGPHNEEIISILVGSLLGDGHGEKRSGGVRIVMEQESRNVGYMKWFHKYLSERGYCEKEELKLKKRISKGGKIRYYYKMQTYTYKNLD